MLLPRATWTQRILLNVPQVSGGDVEIKGIVSLISQALWPSPGTDFPAEVQPIGGVTRVAEGVSSRIESPGGCVSFPHQQSISPESMY